MPGLTFRFASMCQLETGREFLGRARDPAFQANGAAIGACRKALPVQSLRATRSPIDTDHSSCVTRACLVTAGASGIRTGDGARVRPRRRARPHLHDVTDTWRRWKAVAASDPGLTQEVCDVADPAAVTRLFGNVAAAAGRPRRAGEQRRHRGPDRRVRGRGAGRLGTHARRQPDRPVPRARSRDSAAEEKRQRQHGQSLPSAAGRVSAFRSARRTPRRNGAWSASPSRCRWNSARSAFASTRYCPGSVAGPRIDAVFAAKAEVRGQSVEKIRDESLATQSITPRSRHVDRRGRR